MSEEFAELPQVLDGLAMRKMASRDNGYKTAAYAYGYSSFKYIRDLIDEEGCGAVICAARVEVGKLL